MREITYDLIECRVLYARYLERQITQLSQIYPQDTARSTTITRLIMAGLWHRKIEADTDTVSCRLIEAPVKAPEEAPKEAETLTQRAARVMGDSYTAPKPAPVPQKTDYSSMLFEEVQ